MGPRARGLRFWALYLCGCAIAIPLALEVGVRAFVPAARFWPINNIYRRVPGYGVGYTLKPGFVGSAFGVELRTNSLGFRGPEWSVARPPDTFRIAFIGDSHAFGYGLPYESSMSQVVARTLDGTAGKHVESLLFAAPGYNSRQELALLHQYVLAYAPDLIVIVPTQNDDDEAFTADDAGFLWWHTGGNVGTVVDHIIEPAERSRSWLLRHSRLWLYLQLARERRRSAKTYYSGRVGLEREPPGAFMAASYPHENPPPRVIANVRVPVKQMLAVARGRGVPVILAPLVGANSWRLQFAELAREMGTPLVELLGVLPGVHSTVEALDKFSLGWDSHYNAVAHGHFAAALARVIRERGYIK